MRSIRSSTKRAPSEPFLSENSLMTAWEVMRHGQRWWVRARFHLLRQLLARQLPWPAYITELSWREIYKSAEARYVPKRLSGGSAVLVRARHRTPVLSDTPYRAIYADDTLGWGTITQNLAFVDVEGGHSTMLEEPFVRSLATALLVHINQKSASVRLPTELPFDWRNENEVTTSAIPGTS